jgi:hypothetical protein
MHPYITQALMNERVADMHAAAAARRRAREARRLTRVAAETRAAVRPWMPIPEVPTQGRRGAGDSPAQASRDWRRGVGASRPARSADRPALRGAAGVAVIARPEAEDTGADSQALCGTGRGR